MHRLSDVSNLRKTLESSYSTLSDAARIVFLQLLLLEKEEAGVIRILAVQSSNPVNVPAIREGLNSFSADVEQNKTLPDVKNLVDVFIRLSDESVSHTKSVPAPLPVPVPVPVPRPGHAMLPPFAALAHSPAYSQFPDFEEPEFHVSPPPGRKNPHRKPSRQSDDRHPLTDAQSVLTKVYGFLPENKRREFLGILLIHARQEDWKTIIQNQFAVPGDNVKQMLKDIIEKGMFNDHPNVTLFVEEIHLHVAICRSHESLKESLKNEARNQSGQTDSRLPAAAPAPSQLSAASSNLPANNREQQDPRENLQQWIEKFRNYIKLVVTSHRGKNQAKSRMELAMVYSLINVLEGRANPETLITHPDYCKVFGQKHMQELAKGAITYVEYLCSQRSPAPRPGNRM